MVSGIFQNTRIILLTQTLFRFNEACLILSHIEKNLFYDVIKSLSK